MKPKGLKISTLLCRATQRWTMCIVEIQYPGELSSSRETSKGQMPKHLFRYIRIAGWSV